MKDIKILLKKKKREYGYERYKNLSEAEKQRLVEYKKRYYNMLKNNHKFTQYNFRF